MNFEQLSKTSRFLYMLNRKKKIKQQLKLGSISFEIKTIEVLGMSFDEKIEIRYTKQDNTYQDSLDLNNRLETLKWKWNFSNILALLLLIVFLIIYLYIQINYFFSSLDLFTNSRAVNQTAALSEAVKILNNSHSFSTNTNNIINELFIEIINYYNIL